MSGVIYSDANPIIELAKFARGTHDQERTLDLDFMRKILAAANNTEIELYTSSISVAECVAAGDDWGPEVQRFFIGTLTSGRMFKLVQDSIFLAEKARDLRWKHDIRLKGADAIHVASAIEAQAAEFLTWDADISKPKVADKMKVLASFGVSVITPKETKLLPPLYASAQSFNWTVQ